MNNITEKWDEILLAVKTEFDITDVSYENFLRKLKPYSLNDNVLRILFTENSDQIALGFIKRRFEVPLKYKIAEYTGTEYELQFILPNETDQSNTSDNISSVVNSSAYSETNLIPKYTYDTFVVGTNNRYAREASLLVVDAPGELYNPFYIYGGPGLGKTHLMHAIGNEIIKRNPNMHILYVTSEEFTNEVIENMRSKNSDSAMQSFREKYRSIDVLMVDDIQFVIGKDRTQEEFFHTFNTLDTMGKQIILSSDCKPQDLENLNERFRSRFIKGLQADITVPDYETRMAILRKKSESERFILNDDILDYIANNIKSNIRILEGAFNKLKAYNMLEHREITMEIAQKELESMISPEKPKEITPQLIIEVVADHYGISIDQMISKSRSAQYVKPRQIAMYLCEEMTEATKTDVGKLLGDRDHSTVISGINKIKEEYNTKEDYKHEIDTIKNKLNPIVS